MLNPQQLYAIIAEKLREQPDIDQVQLELHIQTQIDLEPHLLQINLGDTTAFQTLVQGGIAYIGPQVHLKDDQLKALLEQLLQRLRPVGIPQNLPRHGAARLVGRDDELVQLHTLLQRGDRVSVAALVGMRGVGKTELAIQYALAHQQNYQGGICWLSARLTKVDSSRTDIDASNTRIDVSSTVTSNVGTQIVDFAKTYLALSPPESIKPELNQVRWCWQNWCEGNVLIILDDVNDYDQIQPYLPPPDSRFRVLLTSWKNILKASDRLELDVLTPDAAIALLEQYIGSERLQAELKSAEELCRKWLGYLPLGLELVGRYLERKQDLSLAEMLQRLQAKKPLEQQSLLQPHPQSGMTAEFGVAVAFDLSWQELITPAKELGCFLSIFDVVPIQWLLVEQSFVDCDSEKLEQARDDFLLDFHLLQREGQGTYKLHELIREFFQSKLPELENVQSLPQAVTSRVAAIAQQNSLLVAEILSKGLLNWRWITDTAYLPTLEYGWQIRIATEGWMKGIGSLSTIVFPLKEDGSLPRLGVSLSQKYADQPWGPVLYVETGWNFSSSSDSENIVELPPECEQVFGEKDEAVLTSAWLKLSDAGWNHLQSAPLDQQASWAWQRTFETIVSSLSKRLQERSLPINAGYLSLEAAWYAAAKLTKHIPSSTAPIPLLELEESLSVISKTSFSLGMQHCIDQLRIEVVAAHDRGETHLSLPESVQNFWNRRGYLPDLVLAYIAGIYEGAVKGYEQLTSMWFPSLVSKMQLAATLPAQVVGIVVLGSDRAYITWFWEPLPQGSQSGIDFCRSDRSPPLDDPRYQAAWQQIHSLRPQGLKYPTKQCIDTPLSMSWLGICPVSELVYQWLWEDLKKIGWVKGDLGNAGNPYWR